MFREDLRAPFPIPGNVFFVGSTHLNASDSNRGIRPESPMATLEAALGRVTADKGDAVLLMPGHVESVNSGWTWPTTASGCYVIGLGEGRNRARFESTVLMQVSPANVHIENVELVPVAAAVVGPLLNVTGNGDILRRIYYGDSSGGDILSTSRIISISGNDSVMEDCTLTETANTIAFGVSPGPISARHRFSRNRIIVDGSTAVVSHLGGAAGDFIMDENFIRSNHATSLTVDLADTTTGMSAWNHIFGGIASPEATFDPGDTMCVENYASDAVDAHAIVVPLTAST